MATPNRLGLMTGQPAGNALISDVPGLTDIHAHPALNAYLFDRNLRKHYFSGRTFNPLSSLSDFCMLQKGGVQVLWSALHIPEHAFFQCRLLRLLAHLTHGGRNVLHLSPWMCLLDMIREMERQVGTATDRFAIARSNAELDAVLASGRCAIVHTVEGAHILESDVDRVSDLSVRGVASLTLAHLFPNDVAGHVEGIPESFHRLPSCPLDTGVVASRGLTTLGHAVVERMVEVRMVPDVTHCTPTARKEVLELVDNRIPVIASHVGVQALNNVPYNLSDNEIERIAETGGVIGVIFMPYWLRASHPGRGLDSIWDTMNHLRAVTGSWDVVAIGTDFDGFTDPPDDVVDAAHLPRIQAMLEQRNLTPKEIAAVLGGNARRVLRCGWR